MRDLKSEVVHEFRKLAELWDATWKVSATYFELSKNGVTLRVRWTIERIPGVFVTLKMETPEYGLPYLVKFKGGSEAELAAASSDEVEKTAEITRKYAKEFLDGSVSDFQMFVEFAEECIKNRK